MICLKHCILFFCSHVALCNCIALGIIDRWHSSTRLNSFLDQVDRHKPKVSLHFQNCACTFSIDSIELFEFVYRMIKYCRYRISSIKRRGFYKIPEVLGAAYIGWRRLLEGGVYICANVSLFI